MAFPLVGGTGICESFAPLSMYPLLGKHVPSPMGGRTKSTWYGVHTVNDQSNASPRGYQIDNPRPSEVAAPIKDEPSARAANSADARSTASFDARYWVAFSCGL